MSGQKALNGLNRNVAHREEGLLLEPLQLLELEKQNTTEMVFIVLPFLWKIAIADAHSPLVCLSGFKVHHRCGFR